MKIKKLAANYFEKWCQAILQLYQDSHRERPSRERQEFHNVTYLEIWNSNQKSSIPSFRNSCLIDSFSPSFDESEIQILTLVNVASKFFQRNSLHLVRRSPKLQCFQLFSDWFFFDFQC